MSFDIGTARYFHPVGTDGEICRAHSRAALATKAAAVALRRGLDDGLTEDQLLECVAEAREGVPAPLPSVETRAAVRAALRAPLTRDADPQDVADAVFEMLPDTPLRVEGPGGRVFFLVPIAAT
ncbi:hypothetical protein [Streptomyces sp. TLI_171]|uniref:hypothetical protein n=1 Tax=Streptomyces sp. TLI_171 TaxID=1938859 RepID=UPI000C197469|nr:hypothetical protein [Streptomyces sp. TLI_171]RKE23471.1 hypothetical protein BX266_6942 [Streptomyces sp. TLI_171]